MSDSRPDTWQHIHAVQQYIGDVIADLQARALAHDQSKLVEPELTTFNEISDRPHDSSYGSEEYYRYVALFRRGIEHHYEGNDHHPEHFYDEGVLAMNLVQVMEMVCDWKAASLRHADGDFAASLDHNAERFGYGDEMKTLILNTATSFGWV